MAEQLNVRHLEGERQSCRLAARTRAPPTGQASSSWRSCSSRLADMAPVAMHSRAGAHLPRWSSVLAVVAHPDDESFGLGAVLAAFLHAGTRLAVLCLTHGELSTVHGVEGDLYRLRGEELTAAADALGVTTSHSCTTPTGRSRRSAAPSSPEK